MGMYLESYYKWIAEGEEEVIQIESLCISESVLKWITISWMKPVFPDELEGEKTYLTSSEIVYAIFTKSSLGGDEPKSLCKAKLTPEWPK